jgi:hypothetical protein
MGIFRKLSNVIDKMFHEDLFDEPVKKRSCKRGKCCCKHRSKREKSSLKEVVHVEKGEYLKSTIHKPSSSYFIPPIPKTPSQIPCQSCHSRHHPTEHHHQEPYHHHHEEPNQHHHYEQSHHHHEEDHHYHHHQEEHDHDHHHQEEYHHHHDHEHEHEHEHVHENQQKTDTFDDEEYRRFYYQTLPQINIQKSVQPNYSLEYEVDDAIRFAEND